MLLPCVFISVSTMYIHMESLIKECKPSGNSASIYVPKEWENHLARVSLLSPRDVILEVLKPHLQYVKGAYIYGSHVRGEAREGSDIDTLVIVSKRIEIKSKKPLELIVATEEELKAELDRHPITLKPILNEAQALINGELLEKLRAVEVDSQKYLDFLSETMQRTKEYAPMIENEQKLRAVVYSLMLRLKAVYHLQLMNEGVKYMHKGFQKYALDHGLDKDAYSGLYLVYRMVRDKKPVSEARITLDDIKRLNEIVSAEAERMKVMLNAEKKKAS